MVLIKKNKEPPRLLLGAEIERGEDKQHVASGPETLFYIFLTGFMGIAT